ncbi:DUF3137 domain-containing protein [Aquimarina spinulae]|uniref:DUF3137 domain-containing protein n=1 Tax=Aquimarina spinulae TaxID=1192023 RepID=UPI000D559A8F|nr:DUF3137 domain-containing protein [Aquimarina spinulae]
MTEKDFNDFFDYQLKPKYKSLESVRKKSFKFNRNVRLLLLLLIIGAIYLIFFQYSQIILCLVCLITAFGIHYFFRIDIDATNFKEQYVEKIVRTLMHKVDNSLTYIPTKGVSRDIFNASRILSTKPGFYQSKGLIQGNLNQTAFRFANVHASSSDSAGGGPKTKTLFKGIFYEADFKLPCKHDLYVLPVSASNFMGKLGEWIKENNLFRPDLVKVEDVIFNKIFVVYGNDEAEAHRILNPETRAKLVALYQETRASVYLSIVNSKPYIAIGDYTNYESYFKPCFSQSSLDFDTIKKDYLLLKRYINITKELNHCI